MVWTAGNQPNPIVKNLGFETRGGAIACNATMRVRGADNIWALGDCAAVPDHLNRGSYHPPTAQHALRQAKTLAHNIAAVLDGRALKPFRFRAIGMLVVLGHQQAAAEIRGMKFSGFIAWLMWRGIYLFKLPGMEKKIRVLLDWGLDLFFPRDIVLTQVPRAAARPELVAEAGAIDEEATHLNLPLPGPPVDDRTIERIPVRRPALHGERELVARELQRNRVGADRGGWGGR
jgi:NADH:ubiquinone reductase (H+-translocating)